MYYKQNQDLSFTKATNFKKLFYISLTINVIFVALLLMAFTKEEPVVTKTKIIKEVVTEKDVVLNDSGITAELTKQGVILAAVACLQSRIESNHGKSNVGIQAKNLFGITFHRCKHVAGRHGVYSKYASYRDCIKCYAHIQARYLKNIDGKYASDPSYISKLKSYK
jgi:Mannosyl-glycoprotein endo-beta-N-acetylglucosaminidase